MSIVRENLMNRKGYTPYCGSNDCKVTPRTNFYNGQFQCPHCEWKSKFPNSFIREYKSKWGLS